MLRSVIEDGTGWRADLGREVGGKTGTTNRYTDAWFVGFIPELVTGVWIGEDSPRTMNYSGTGRIGSGNAVQIWRKIMDKAIVDIPETTFDRPESIVSLEIDPIQLNYHLAIIQGQSMKYLERIILPLIQVISLEKLQL